MILTCEGICESSLETVGNVAINKTFAKLKKNYSHTPLYRHQLNMDTSLERFSCDLDMKMREQNRNNKRTEIERFDWFIERIQKRVAFGERSSETKLHAQELSRNQPILRFDVILQHDWPIEQCFLRINVFFGGKTKRPCFDLFIYWLITNEHLPKPFSRSYENHSIMDSFPCP